MKEAYFYVPDYTVDELKNSVNAFAWLKDIDYARLWYEEEDGGAAVYMQYRDSRAYSTLKAYIYEISDYQAEAETYPY